MQAQDHQHEECQHLQVHNTPTSDNSSDVTTVSNDDSIVDSSHVEMLESLGQIWPDNPNVLMITMFMNVIPLV